MVQCIYCGVTGFNFQKNIAFLSLKINFVLANSVDPDEMPHFLMQDTVIYEKAPDINGGRRVNEL